MQGCTYMHKVQISTKLISLSHKKSTDRPLFHAEISLPKKSVQFWHSLVVLKLNDSGTLLEISLQCGAWNNISLTIIGYWDIGVAMFIHQFLTFQYTFFLHILNFDILHTCHSKLPTACCWNSLQLSPSSLLFHVLPTALTTRYY